jgi:hypothetical protein
MTRKIRIRAGAVDAVAMLNDSPVAQAIWDALPIAARANTWGDEVYFSIDIAPGVVGPVTDAVEVVSLGDVAYWPPGGAFCIFFGPTPSSRGNEIRPASAVSVVGKIDGDPKVFRAVRAGTGITLETLGDG